ncbi:hypothetical protein F5148DRAFT_949796, partial [Russula earlei]
AAPSTISASPTVPTFPATPLASIHYPYSALPYQVITGQYVRGTQYGYNQCNASTQNQQSLCQTLIVNSLSDVCTYAPPQPNSTIGDTEGIEVSWCTKNGYGTRGIPPGTITGGQMLRTPYYIQIVLFVDQTKINLQAGDYGGELDGWGQDGLGNPIGGMVYTSAFNNQSTLQQTSYWNVFEGGNVVGVKVCDPNGPNPAGYCQHTLDRIGLPYNMPNNAQNNVFESCDSDPMDIPGIYTVNGQTSSYAQPPESLGPITTIPYTPRVPSSSNCQTYQSTALYTDFLSLATSTSTASGTSPTGASNGPGSGSRSASAASASATGSNGAGAVTISLFSTILGVTFSIAFLA